MHFWVRFLVLIIWGVIAFTRTVLLQAAEAPVGEATLQVHAGQIEPSSIPQNLTGKFCEHLGANIYNGMDAQILRNSTFADYPFGTGQMSPDGIVTFHFEREKIESELRRQAANYGWPDSELGGLLSARRDGLACFWAKAGEGDAVVASPDTGPYGGRVQRLELKAGAGIKQWIWLPLHRTHKYEFELLARSPDLKRVALRLSRMGSNEAIVEANVDGVAADWRTITGTLEVKEGEPSDDRYCLTLATASPGQLVIGHLFLRPADHVNGADPDVIRLLKEARLPLLRWPGGNFVSAYHWEDGVGPRERRLTRPNYAWGGVEPNTFGTDEFVAFCRAVGCEPMICVNAGNGTPTEAARWVEYCNGRESSPMGARRAANGHPEPFNIRHWEVGNELWGRWQAHWTTAAGYVDRYRQFAAAMKEADPTIELHGCGAPVLWGQQWNETLISSVSGQLHSITDHPLIGGDVPRSTDPMDVFRDFMYVPDILERRWSQLRSDMIRYGIQQPRLAITELQMFAHLAREAEGNAPAQLTRDNLVNPGTLAEALYDTLIYHVAVRLQPFVELVTHSATVNHGGGLRKERERVYANPCYYAQLLFAEFAAAKPVKVELNTAQEQAPVVLPDIKNSDGARTFGVVDALAAVTSSGDLLLSIVHRGTAGPVRLAIKVDGFATATRAEIRTLQSAVPWAANRLEKPRAVEPVRTEAVLRDGSMTLLLQPFSVTQAHLTSNN